MFESSAAGAKFGSAIHVKAESESSRVENLRRLAHRVVAELEVAEVQALGGFGCRKERLRLGRVAAERLVAEHGVLTSEGAPDVRAV